MTLLRFLWDRKRTVYLLILFFLPLSVLSDMIGVYLPKAVLAELEQGQSVSHFILVLGGISLLLVVSLFGKDMIDGRLNHDNALLHRELQMSYTRKLLYIDYKYLEDPEYLSLRNRAKSIIYSIYSAPGVSGDYLGMFLIKLAHTGTQCVLIAVYLVWLWRLSPMLVLFLLVTVMLLGAMSVPAGRKSQRFDDQAGLAWKKVQYLTERTGDFSLAKDSRLYSMENWILPLLDKYMGIRLHYKGLSLWNDGCWAAARDVVLRLQNLVVYGYLIYEMLRGNIVPSDLVLYAGMIGTLSGTIQEGAFNFTQLYHVSLSLQRVQNFFQFGEDREPEGLPLHREEVSLTLEHVSFSFPDSDRKILDDVSFSVQTGDRIAVVGLNGAGKTTLMKLICGLLEPTQGRILLNGKDMKELSPEERYSWFSCAFQDISFLPFSIQENISMIPDEERDGIDGRTEIDGRARADEKDVQAVDDGSGKNVDQEVAGRVKDCLQKAGMWEKINSLPQGVHSLLEKDINEGAVDFSGGERQRLVLAKALYRDTSVLLLDEPTAALDPLAENELYTQYADFSKDKLTFFVSHRLSSTSFCDRIFLLQDGCIAEEGTHEELLKKRGLYAKMFTLQGHYYNQS